MWHWLIESDASLAARIGLGVGILSTLAAVDLRRSGRRATRWREYLFLLYCVLLALLYGVLNDLITCRVSWEYFYFGKDLAPVLGAHTPPDSARLSIEAVKIGLKATWTAGLLIGVALLLANNPGNMRRLSYYRLLHRPLLILTSAALFAVILGAVAHLGGIVGMSDDFREMVRRDEFRPYRFMTVYGIHLGGYLGGMLGTIGAVVSIRRERQN